VGAGRRWRSIGVVDCETRNVERYNALFVEADRGGRVHVLGGGGHAAHPAERHAPATRLNRAERTAGRCEVYGKVRRGRVQPNRSGLRRRAAGIALSELRLPAATAPMTLNRSAQALRESVANDLSATRCHTPRRWRGRPGSYARGQVLPPEHRRRIREPCLSPPWIWWLVLLTAVGMLLLFVER